jgi:SsrA-binding protein
MKVFVENRKARAAYKVLEEVESGIVLTGSEVKSIRAGRVSLSDAYVKVVNGQGVLINLYIHPYGFADNRNYDPRRTRLLLMHKYQLRYLESKAAQKGLTLIPMKIYEKNNRFKVGVALVRGKTQVDRRKELRERDLNREMQIVLRGKKMA